MEFSPELRQATGDIVIAGTNLELELLQTVRRIEDWTWQQTRDILAKPGGARQQFNAAVDRHAGGPHGVMLRDFRDRAEALLRDRNAVVHGVLTPVSQLDQADSELHWYSMRDNALVPVDLAWLADRADRLRVLAEELTTWRRGAIPRPTDAASPDPDPPVVKY